MSVKTTLRITCYYCDERIEVDFYQMGNRERANNELRRHGWIFGVQKEGDQRSPGLGNRVIFDPVCNTCGRGVVQQMLTDGGGQIDPDAKASLRKVFPDLFEAN